MVISSSWFFLPKTLSVLLQHAIGAPTLHGGCSPTWFYNYQSLWAHRKPGPEPPWPPSLWPLGATPSASCFREGWVLPALFWELGGVLGSLHPLLPPPPPPINHGGSMELVPQGPSPL